MKKEIFINCTLSETRIALVDNTVLQQIHIDRQEHPSLVGNIYKAKVLRVMPGMQAAFVDIGDERSNSTAFDMHVWQWKYGCCPLSCICYAILRIISPTYWHA